MRRQDVYSGEPWGPQGGREGEGRSGAQLSPERGLKQAALQRCPELGVGAGRQVPTPTGHHNSWDGGTRAGDSADRGDSGTVASKCSRERDEPLISREFTKHVTRDGEKL